jgi:hypothetical protein
MVVVVIIPGAIATLFHLHVVCPLSAESCRGAARETLKCPTRETVEEAGPSQGCCLLEILSRKTRHWRYIGRQVNRPVRSACGATETMPSVQL